MMKGLEDILDGFIKHIVHLSYFLELFLIFHTNLIAINSCNNVEFLYLLRNFLS